MQDGNCIKPKPTSAEPVVKVCGLNDNDLQPRSGYTVLFPGEKPPKMDGNQQSGDRKTT